MPDVPPVITPRSELLADVIEVDDLYRMHTRRLWIAVVLLLVVVLVFALTAFALVVRSHVFVLPQTPPSQGVRSRSLTFVPNSSGRMMKLGVVETAPAAAMSPARNLFA